MSSPASFGASLPHQPTFDIAAKPYLSPKDYEELEFLLKHKKFENTNQCLSLLFQAHEAEQNPKTFGLAMHHYISLAEVYGKEGQKEVCLRILRRAEELAHRPRTDVAICNFFERLEVTLLQSLSLYPVARLKEKIRTLFNEKIKEVCSLRPMKKPSCFICFNADEMDVKSWLNNILIPDLKAAGIEPVCSLEKFKPGCSVLDFESLARTSDYVIVICTPDLKRKSAELTSSGIYREINDHIRPRLQEEKVWPILFKGSYEQSCPSCFPMPWCVTATPYDYYKILEIIFASRGLDRGGAGAAVCKIAEEGRALYYIQGRSRVIPDVLPSLPSLSTQAVRSLDQWKTLPHLHHVPRRNHEYFHRRGIDLDAAFYKSRIIALISPESTRYQTGKTEIALDYAHKAWRYDKIIWVDASNPENLRTKSTWINDLLKRPGFLLVLDDMESWSSLEVYFPALNENLLGHVLITSKNRDWEKADPIEVLPFSDEEALAMLQEITGNFAEDKATEKLIAAMEGSPQRIRDAAEKIREQQISFTVYWEQERENLKPHNDTPHKKLMDLWQARDLSPEAISECLKVGKSKWGEHLYPLIKQMTAKRTMPDTYKKAVIPFFELLFVCKQITQPVVITYLNKQFDIPIEEGEFAYPAIIAILNKFFLIKQVNEGIVLDMPKEA